MKTYEMQCPDCETVLTLEMEPTTDDPEEAIECPECHGEFDWEHDAATDTVTLMPYEDDDAEADDDEEDEEDEEE